MRLGRAGKLIKMWKRKQIWLLRTNSMAKLCESQPRLRGKSGRRVSHDTTGAELRQKKDTRDTEHSVVRQRGREI